MNDYSSMRGSADSIKRGTSQNKSGQGLSSIGHLSNGAKQGTKNPMKNPQKSLNVTQMKLVRAKEAYSDQVDTDGQVGRSGRDIETQIQYPTTVISETNSVGT